MLVWACSARLHLHDLARSVGWFDLPESRSLFWLHQFAVVRERYATVMVSKLQSSRRSVLEVRHVIAGEAVSQRVLRPLPDGSVGACLLE